MARVLLALVGLAAVGVIVLAAQAARAENAGLDPTFGTGGIVVTDAGVAERAQAVAQQPDGRLLAAGYSTLAGTPAFLLARYTVTGALDSSFGGGSGRALADFGGSDEARALVRQNDGRVVLAGVSKRFVGPLILNVVTSDIALARHLNNGQLDPSFGLNADGLVLLDLGAREEAMAVALQSDEKIIVAGSIMTGADESLLVVRLSQIGALDPTFGSGGLFTRSNPLGSVRANAVAIDSQNRIVVAGEDDAAGMMVVLRLTPNGAPDPTFGIGGSRTITFTGAARANAVAIQADGAIVVAGSAPGTGGRDFAVARLTTNGSPDPAFAGVGQTLVDFGGTVDDARAIGLQSGGRIVLAGHSNATNTGDFAVVRLDSTGVPDPSFSPNGRLLTDLGGTDRIDGITIQPDNKIVAAGSTQTQAGPRMTLARYDNEIPTPTPTHSATATPTGTATPTSTPSATPTEIGRVARLLSIPGVSHAGLTGINPSVVPATATPTVLSIPIENGSFANGLAGWTTFDGRLGAGLVGSNPLNGTSAVQLGTPGFNPCGGVPTDGFGQVAQRFTVPNGPRTLRFDWLIRTRDVKNTLSGRIVDTLDAYLIDGPSMPSGPLLDSALIFREGRTPTVGVFPCDTPEVTLSGTASIDLSSRAGQTLWLVFQTWNRIDNNANTYAYIDNVRVE